MKNQMKYKFKVPICVPEEGVHLLLGERMKYSRKFYYIYLYEYQAVRVICSSTTSYHMNEILLNYDGLEMRDRDTEQNGGKNVGTE